MKSTPPHTPNAKADRREAHPSKRGTISGNTQTGAPAADARFTPRSIAFEGRLLRDRPVADETGLGKGVRIKAFNDPQKAERWLLVG